MTKWIRVLHLVLLGSLAARAGGAHAADTSYKISGDAGFEATGKPGFLRINGQGGHLEGELVLDGKTRLVRADIKVKLADLKTGIDLRDEHMKTKYLDVAKHPEAVLHLDEVKLGGSIPDEVSVTGKLTLHGVTKPVEVELDLKDDGAGLSGEGEFEIVLGDFGVDIPKFMGVTVAETVAVKCTFRAVTK